MDLEELGITDELINEILDNLLLLLGVSEPDENAPEKDLIEYEIKVDVLKYLITETCVKTLIRTRRETFPEALKYLVTDVVKYIYTTDIDDEDLSAIQSMSEAGRSISYGVSTVIQAKVSASIQKQLDERDRLIYEYRLMYKTHNKY